jgi:hypothetical protein
MEGKMAATWRSHDTSIVVPQTVLEVMWRRARGAFDVARGGRYDARTASTLLLWSGPLEAPGSRPVGSVRVRWGAPVEGSATIREVSWRTDHPAREAQIWRALEVLAGADWPLIQAAAVRPSDEVHNEVHPQAA